MLIFGDYAYPFEKINYSKGLFKKKNILFNCEGYLVGKDDGDFKGVYNNMHSLSSFQANNTILGLANNHIMDSPSGVVDSIRLANKNHNVRTVGAGSNLKEASKPLIIEENGVEIAIIAAGWDVIGCKYATSRSQGIMPLQEDFILPIVIEQKSLGRKVLVYAHWGYELEFYPHPTHRNLALRLINAGADIIVGCHAHCLQGYEKHNNGYIFYGVGNSVFKQNHYFNGKLKFPDYCSSGLSIDWDPLEKKILVANIMLNDSDEIFISKYIKPENHQRLKELSIFSGMDKDNYLEYFSKMRRKKKFLPIFKEPDMSVLYKLKRYFVIIRASIIKVLFICSIKKIGK